MEEGVLAIVTVTPEGGGVLLEEPPQAIRDVKDRTVMKSTEKRNPEMRKRHLPLMEKRKNTSGGKKFAD